MIIGLCGYKGAGKSTVAEAAINLHGRSLPPIQRIGFADPMVEMLITMGVDRETIRDKSKWEDPQPILCGQTIRYAARTLGTKWGRECLHENVWTNIAISRAQSFKGVTIIDNVRYPSEAEAVRDAGGVVVAFLRSGQRPDDPHESESYIGDIQTKMSAYSYVNKGTDLASSALYFANTINRIVKFEVDPPFG